MSVAKMIYKNLGKIIRFFCDNTTIPGFAWLTMKNISGPERMFWIIINTTFLITTIVLIHHLWEDFMVTPTIVTLDSVNLPVQKIKFPGISICDVNKISRKRANEFAIYLNQFTKKGNVRDILSDIKLLGNLYDFNLRKAGRLALFQDFLDDFDNITSINDPMNRMVQLAPKCEEMLKECKWGGRKYDCEKLFLFRLTYDGFCCVFNYVRKVSKRLMYATQVNVSAPSSPIHPLGVGLMRGLQLTLNNNVEDYFYSTFPAIGYTVQIFYPNDFPDKISGSFSEVFVNAGTETLINMKYSLTKTSEAVRLIPMKLRKCKFQMDHTTIFGPYRYSDCLVECKIRSIMSLCNCVPFTVPVLDEYDDPNELLLCTLIDIPCLNKYREKWSRYYPNGPDNDHLDQEKHDSISCPKCLPDCNSIVYEASTTSIPLRDQSGNSTHINIFFNSVFGNSYKIDVTQTWFEVLSTFGGFLSLFMGVSVISLMEVFILIYRLGRYCFNRSN